MKSFSKLKPSNGREKLPRMEDLVDVLTLKEKAWTQVRILPGGVLSLGVHWVKTTNKDGKEISFKKLCLGWDSEQERSDVDKCPYCAAPGVEGPVQEYWVQVIDRYEQEQEPARKPKPTEKELRTQHKDKDSRTWTPVKCLRMPPSLVRKIMQLEEINIVKGVRREVTDEQYGFDLQIYYDPQAAGGDKYNVQKGDRTPLTDDEKDYLTWELNEKTLTPESYESAVAEVERLQSREEKSSRKSRRNENPDDDYSLDDDEDDDDYRPKAKGSKAQHKSRRSQPRDEDDYDADDADDDEEPPRKAPSAKKVAKPVKKSQRVMEDDDDEDDDEDDYKPRKKSSQGPKRAQKVEEVEEEDEDEFDDDELDDDLDDLDADEDEDEGDYDDDDEEDDDDE